MSTIREVAARADVSIATVSRVINNDTHYKITPQTRERVWQAVAELNYHTPVSARKETRAAPPASYRRVGCVMSLRGGKYTDPYYLALLSGVESYLGEHRCEVSFVRTRDELADRETLLRTFRNPPDGLILMYPLEKQAYQYVRERVPHIVGIDSGHAEIDNIGYEHFHSALHAVTLLYEAGYRKIGFVGCHDRHATMAQSERYMGYAMAMQQFSLPMRPEWEIDTQWEEIVCEREIEKLYRKANLPRAIFAASDLMAMAVLRCLYSLGVPVPQRVAVIGLTNIEMSKYSNPPLSTIEIPTHEIGRTAAKVLIERMDGDTSLPKHITLPSRYIARDSI